MNNLRFCLFIYFLKFYLFIFTVLCLRCCVQDFSSCGEQGLLFVAVCELLIVVASLVVKHGLQACGLQQLWRVDSVVVIRRLQSTDSVVVVHRLSSLRHVGSSRTRAQTCVPCIGRQILNHCTTKEVPSLHFCLSERVFVLHF